jgi:hypothetical protein
MDFWKQTELIVKTIDDIIRTNMHKKYLYVDNIEYHRLFLEDPSKASQIYWKEILDRAHLTSLITILRNKKWINGIHIGTEKSNAFIFAACLRSLIESVADSMHALVFSSLEISKLFPLISRALSGKAGNFIYQNKSLEDKLIHFLYAKKLAKGNDAPDSHKAKNPSEYLKIFKDTDVDGIIKDLYFLLCDIVHPGTSSVFIFNRELNHEILININQDKKIISDILDKYSKILFYLFSYAFNPSLITFGVLNYFNLTELHTKELLNINLFEIPAWQDIQKNLNNAQKQVK